jgi:hypothetical protein
MEEAVDPELIPENLPDCGRDFRTVVTFPETGISRWL